MTFNGSLANTALTVDKSINLDLSASNIAAGIVSSGTISSSAIWNNYYQAARSSTEVTEENNDELFKQIVSLLGLKIINVIIKDGVVKLVCRRNRKLFTIEVSSYCVVIKNKDIEIARIILSSSGDLYEPNIAPFSPSPFTQPIQPNTPIYTFPDISTPWTDNTCEDDGTWFNTHSNRDSSTVYIGSK
jgi:hypothetical protein